MEREHAAAGSGRIIGWIELWAICSFDLRIAEDCIGELTSAQIDALLDRKREADRHLMICAGIVAAAVVNSNPYRGENAPVVSPLDFIGEGKESREPTEEEKLEQFKNFFNAMKRTKHADGD